MKNSINRALSLMGYKIVRTTDDLHSAPTVVKRTPPQDKEKIEGFSWVDEYANWTKEIFGVKVLPILDRRKKINASFPENHKFFSIAANGILDVENRIVHELLRDISDNNVPGALVEFGVFEGAWINKLYDFSERVGLVREIWGFDSFQGLSKPDPKRDTAYWKEGMFSAGLDMVRRNVKADRRPRIKLIEGWFSESLQTTTAQSLRNISYARIDCDIYQPTVECLDYLGSRLSHGAILVFDDWSHNHTVGETRAFAEWAPTVPDLEFEFLFYGLWDHFYVRVWHRGRKRW